MFLPQCQWRDFVRFLVRCNSKRIYYRSQFLWCLILGRDILGNKASELCKIGTADSEDIWIKLYIYPMLLLLLHRFQPNFQIHLRLVLDQRKVIFWKLEHSRLGKSQNVFLGLFLNFKPPPTHSNPTGSGLNKKILLKIKTQPEAKHHKISFLSLL